MGQSLMMAQDLRRMEKCTEDLLVSLMSREYNPGGFFGKLLYPTCGAWIVETMHESCSLSAQIFPTYGHPALARCMRPAYGCVACKVNILTLFGQLCSLAAPADLY